MRFVPNVSEGTRQGNLGEEDRIVGLPRSTRNEMQKGIIARHGSAKMSSIVCPKRLGNEAGKAGSLSQGQQPNYCWKRESNQRIDGKVVSRLPPPLTTFWLLP